MIQTSDAYKEMMKKPIRNRGYISVSLGVVNQNAQGNAKLDENTTKEYYSKGGLFDDTNNEVTYGTLEQNFTKADGSFRFPPRNTQTIDLQNNGIVVPHGGSLIIKFDTDYDIKGLTIDFTETSYPTDFTIVTDEETINVSDNDTANFTTEAVLGSTSTITITPTSMLGGVQCMHIKRVVMGVGLTFQNSIVESADLESFVSSVSIETSYKELDVSAFDNNGQFDIDNESAFINYLETGQPVNVSFGVDLDDGTQEWHQVASCRLKDWGAKKGRVSFKATDLLSQTDETYSHMVLTSRTAKSEFEAIFQAMGLTPNDYYIDDYFASINITNPVEENAYRDCLQLLANATRGVVYEDENGIVRVEKNFDKGVNVNETNYAIGYGIRKTDKNGNSYLSSYWKSLDDGTFRVISEKNLFNPSEEAGNTVEIVTSQYLDYALLPVEVIDNFICQGEDSEDGQRAIVAVTIKCPRNGNSFPIKESGWYCAGSGSRSQSFRSEYSAYAKIGNKNLQVEYSYGKFNFYVAPEDLGSGDLEVSFAYVKRYRTSETLKNEGIGIRKGKLNNNGYMEGYETQEELYEDYFLERYPQMLLEWQGGWRASNANLLFTFKDPKPTQIKVEERVTGVSGTKVTYFDIKDNFLEYEMSFLTNLILVHLIKGKPNGSAILYHPTVKVKNAYDLSFNAMLESPYAVMDEKVKAIRVKIFTYQNDGEEIRQVDDEVYYTETLDSTGVVKTVQNPLISTSAQAELVAKWMKAYYTKNLTYNYEYRGEPTLQSNDIMYAESEASIVNALDAEKTKLSFNGAFRGQIEARKTLIIES